MSIIFKAMTAAAVCVLMTACGGGGDAGSSASGGTDTKLLPYAPYLVASVRSAPAEGTALSGVVRIELSGYYLTNVHLLPAGSSDPAASYGKFNPRSGYEFETPSGYLDLDTTRLPNGPLQVRIVGFDPTRNNQPVEIMGTRTWNIGNAAGSSAGLSVGSVSAPAAGATVSGTTRLEVRGTGLVNVELLPASGYSPKLGAFNISADRTRAWLDLDTRSLPDGVQTARISAFNVTEGQSGPSEVIAMQPRQWNVQNGTRPGFTVGNLMAPLHGETISGPVRLEVRGTGIENVELLPSSGYSPKYGTFSVYPQKNAAYLEFDPRTLPPGLHDFRISVFSRPAGSPDAQEIVVMPARQWKVQ